MMRHLHWCLAAAFLLAYASGEAPLALHLIPGYAVAFLAVPFLLRAIRRSVMRRRGRDTRKGVRRRRPRQRVIPWGKFWSLAAMAVLVLVPASAMLGILAEDILPQFNGMLTDVHEFTAELALVAAGLHAGLALRPKIKRALLLVGTKQLGRRFINF